MQYALQIQDDIRDYNSEDIFSDYRSSNKLDEFITVDMFTRFYVDEKADDGPKLMATELLLLEGQELYA